MSDVGPSTSPFAVICRAEGCGNKVCNPCGHLVCRRHAPCTVRYSEGAYWTKGECEVCCSLWDKCLSSSRDVKKPAVTSLKSWVAGFSRNTKGPYLDCELSRAVLFPGAKESSVFGFSSLEEEEQGVEEVSQEDEDRLLQGPSAATPAHSAASSAHSEMEVEHAPSLAVHPSPAPSVAPPAAPDTGLAAVLAAMTAMQETFTATIGKLEQKIQVLESGASTEVPGVPLSSCPPTTSTNPWTPVGKARVEEGMLKLSHDTYYKLENLEFYPSMDVFPNCYFRLNSAAASNKIPAETVILPQSEASALMATYARKHGFTQEEKGLIESRQLVFSAPKDLKLPFWTKATKAVLKSFKENEVNSYALLKEYKAVTAFSFRECESVPEVEGFSSIFTEQKLKADSPSFQLKDTFEKVPNSLLVDEMKARYRLARSLSLQVQLETMLAADPSQKDLAVSCKMNSATYAEHLAAFITAKRKCRSAVLGKAGIKHETTMLVESSVFCPNLFPEDKVQEVLDLAKRENVSLFKRWAMPPLKPVASASSTSSTSGGKKRRYKPRNWQSGSAKRQHSAQESSSPATNPKFEAKGKSAGSYSGKKGAGGSRPYQPKDRKPFSKGKQSKGGSQ